MTGSLHPSRYKHSYDSERLEQSIRGLLLDGGNSVCVCVCARGPRLLLRSIIGG